MSCRETAPSACPLYSVNVTKAKLRLLRINDRNLIQTIQRGLFLRAVDNYDADTIAQDTGEQVWTGTVAVDPQRNQRVTTLVPVSEMVPQMKSGVYLLVAERTDGGEDKYGYKATQWLIVTDYGLTTMTGDDGLHVFVRSLDTGQAVEGVTVKLYARNNGELGSAVSDGSGQVGFAPGLMRGDRGAHGDGGHGLRQGRRLRFPRSDPARLRSLRPRRRRAAGAERCRCLPLCRSRRLSAGRDGASGRSAARHHRAMPWTACPSPSASCGPTRSRPIAIR